MAVVDPPRDSRPAEDGEAPSVRSGLQARLAAPRRGPVVEQAPADIFGVTDRGRVRSSNQDHFVVAELRRTMVLKQSSVAAHNDRRLEAPEARLLAVADGMGGYEGGGLASSVAIDTLADFVHRLLPWFAATAPSAREELGQLLRAGVRGSDEAVFRTAVELELDDRMGTTLTAAYIAWPEAYLMHVGDSRAHLIRDGGLERLTRDHTVAQQLLAARALDARQAARSQLRHVLVNTVGGQREKNLMVDLRVVELRAGDTLLLTTDGVAGHVKEEELPGLVADGATAEDAAGRILDLVQSRGATDNVTVLVARF